MTYPQQPSGPPPPPYGPATPKRRSKLPWILGGLAAILLICCGGGAIAMMVAAGNDSSSGGKTVAQGEPARDGKFEFTVTGSSCGNSTLKAGLLSEKAQGVFCEVKVTVKNIGDKAQMFDGSAQKAFDAAGTEYSNDTAAELAANEGAPTFLEEINPGNQVSGILIFDVPVGTKLAKIELHDSPFSGGVTVELA